MFIHINDFLYAMNIIRDELLIAHAECEYLRGKINRIAFVVGPFIIAQIVFDILILCK